MPAGSAPPECCVDDADLADEAGLRVGPGANLEAASGHHRLTGADQRRGVLQIDDHDVERPVRIRLAKWAKRQGLARQHKEAAFGLQWMARETCGIWDFSVLRF